VPTPDSSGDRANRGAIALVLPFYLAYQASRAAVEGMRRLAAIVLARIRAAIGPLLRLVLRGLLAAWRAMVRLVGRVIAAVAPVLHALLTPVGRALRLVMHLARELVAAIWRGAASLIELIRRALRAIIGPVMPVVRATVELLVHAVVAIIEEVASLVRLGRVIVALMWRPVRAALARLVVAAAAAWAVVERLGSALWRPIQALIVVVATRVQAAIAPLSRVVTAAVSRIRRRVRASTDAIRRGLRELDAGIRAAVLAIRVRLGLPIPPPGPPRAASAGHSGRTAGTDSRRAAVADRRPARPVATASGIVMPPLVIMLGVIAVAGEPATWLAVLGVVTVSAVIGFVFVGRRAGWQGWLGCLVGAAIVALLAMPFFDQDGAGLALGLWLSLGMGLTFGYLIGGSVGLIVRASRGPNADRAVSPAHPTGTTPSPTTARARTARRASRPCRR
jgi:hypothetical protein